MQKRFTAILWGLVWLWTPFQGSAESCTLRSFLPNAPLRQGEIRIVETADTVSFQILLYTRFPWRVIRDICDKEENNWPPGSPCHGDSQKYCEALKTVPGSIERERKASGTRDASYRWIIEFIASTSAPRVDLIEIQTQGPRNRLVVSRTRSLASPAVSEAYIRQNMAFILLDLFGSQREQKSEVTRLLHRLKESQ